MGSPKVVGGAMINYFLTCRNSFTELKPINQNFSMRYMHVKSGSN
jgi:hypothetical protein